MRLAELGAGAFTYVNGQKGKAHRNQNKQAKILLMRRISCSYLTWGPGTHGFVGELI